MDTETNEPMKKDQKYVGCWVTPELHAQVVAIAKADDRSLQVFMRRLIEKIVKDHENADSA